MSNNQVKIFLSFLFVCALTVCSNAAEESIVVKDYIVGSPYEIVSVDGKAPKRQEHGMFVTYVPFVLVSEGEHLITVKLNDLVNDLKSEKIIELTVNAKKGKTYSIQDRNGKPILVLESGK